VSLGAQGGPDPGWLCQLAAGRPTTSFQLKEAAEEFLGRRGVTPGLNEDVQNIPVLVNRTP
jgi:hypothetical protein